MKIKLLALLISISMSPAMAKQSQTKPEVRKEKLQTMGAQLGTDFRFSGLSVSGRYQSANEGLATIENEKPLLDLLDYDRNFNQRIKEASRSWK
jgi:hypothetical protein